MAVTAIRLEKLSKSFRRHSDRSPTTIKTYVLQDLLRRRRRREDITWAVRNVNLTVEQGRTVGIIGRNGSGKSTLLHLIRGTFRPTSGTVWVGGRLSTLIELGAGFHPDLTGRENIIINGVILGLSKAELKMRMTEIVRFAELEEFIDEPVRTYSTGMYMRLGFAVAVHVNPEILLIDEVLAVGDLPFVHKCHERMEQFKREGKTVVLVTHDLGMVQSWCDQAVWIDEGTVRAIGEPSQVVELYRRAMDHSCSSEKPANSRLPQVTRRQIKWFMALSEASPTFEHYAQMCMVAVHTGLKNTTLKPHLIYDGQDNAFTAWLERRQVTVIRTRTTLYERLRHLAEKTGDPNILAVGSGVYLKTELPRLAPELGIHDEFVVITDCDVLFLAEVGDFFATLRPQYFAVAPEFDQKNYELMNTGVMLLNLARISETYEAFVSFIAQNLATFAKTSWDQHAYQAFYRDQQNQARQWEELPPAYNWKPYWGKNRAAKIVHFHGPKPFQRVAMANGSAPDFLRIYATSAYDEFCTIWDSMLLEATGQDSPTAPVENVRAGKLF